MISFSSDRFGQALYELTEKINHLSRTTSEARNKILFFTAARQGHRYWTDTTGTVRRMPGKKPLLSHGKKAR